MFAGPVPAISLAFLVSFGASANTDNCRNVNVLALTF